MDQKPLPGAFILEAAQSGLQAAANLFGFAPSPKSKDLASKLSLSATLLSEIGKEVNQNAGYFKENFQQTFENVPIKCKKEYEMVLVGLEKATAWKKGEPLEGTEDPPKKPWKRLLFALSMGKDEFKEFENSLDESWLRALMLQYIVSLVVLQVRAQKQDLTPSELNNLGRLKKGLGTLLETIRDSEVASVLAFGLGDLTKAANAVQVTEAANDAVSDAANEICSPDDTSSISATSTILNPSLNSVASPKKEAVVPVIEPVHPPKPEDKYEMYRASTKNHVKKGNQTALRLFGIPIKIDRTEREFISNMDRIPATVEEIKDFIETEKDDKNTQPATLKSLVNLSPMTSTAIYTLINSKNEERIYPRRKWSTEVLVPYEWWESRRFGRKQKKTDGYIVILRGEVTYRPFSRHGPLGPPPPPPGGRLPGPPPNWPGSAPPGGQPVIVNLTRPPPPPPPPPQKKTKKVQKSALSAAQIELTQQETEKVINDFLATFSTLYDGIPVEERGAALKAIDLDEADDLVDYDSDDSSSSGSSRSLVDD